MVPLVVEADHEVADVREDAVVRRQKVLLAVLANVVHHGSRAEALSVRSDHHSHRVDLVSLI